MASILNVDQIRTAAGTNAMTIDSSGYVSMPNTTELDIWYLASDVAISSAGSHEITALTRWATDWEKIGTGMSHSSGVFTFPSTGKWRCTAKLYFQASNGGYYFGIINKFSTDSGANYNTRAYAYQNAATSEFVDTTTVTFYDVTNASTARAKFTLDTHNSGTMGGDSGQLRTYVKFEKIAST